MIYTQKNVEGFELCHIFHKIQCSCCMKYLMEDVVISLHILYMCAIQGLSGGKHIDLSLEDNVLLPSDFAEHIYHVGSSHDMHPIIKIRMIPGGKDIKKGRHAVFFTAVKPNGHRTFSRKGLRRDEAQDCSSQTQLENKPNTQRSGVI